MAMNTQKTDRTVKVYEGKSASVTWHGRLCIHVAECGRANGDLFEGGRKPWCNPDLGEDDEVLDVVMRCPTGALSANFNDANKKESAPDENTITLVYNGPLVFSGDLNLEDAAENAPGLKYRAALCRCGLSKNKPYCDNSHEQQKQHDYGAVGKSGTKLESSGGELTIKPIKNGPLRVSGNMTLISGTGRRAWQGTQTVLCRCGLSKNKPFCDGTHKSAGFTTD